MRTTLDIEDDVLAAAKEIARRQNVSAGQVVSRLLREALSGQSRRNDEPANGGRTIGGFRPFPGQGVVVTNEQIDRLRDEEGV